jgi:hypothetical protein
LGKLTPRASQKAYRLGFAPFCNLSSGPAKYAFVMAFVMAFKSDEVRGKAMEAWHPTVNSLDEADRASGGHPAGKVIFDPWRRCSIAN